MIELIECYEGLHLAAQVEPALMYLYIQDIPSLIGDTPQVVGDGKYSNESKLTLMCYIK